MWGRARLIPFLISLIYYRIFWRGGCKYSTLVRGPEMCATHWWISRKRNGALVIDLKSPLRRDWLGLWSTLAGKWRGGFAVASIVASKAEK